MQAYVNIACGDTYIKNWTNLDFSPHSANVRKADLLKQQLPIEDNYADIVYSSHFIEHIPHDMVLDFLKECNRITKSGGLIRLVLPDWEELCATYLALRQSGQQHEKADFLLIEMLDQCVRRSSGGKLGDYYTKLQKDPHKNTEMIEFLYSRTGHNLSSDDIHKPNRFSEKIKNLNNFLDKFRKLYIHFILALLPSAFRNQNVSLTSIGEKHAWMYDFHSIRQLLKQAGFRDVKRLTANTSNISDFPFFPLDIDDDGNPRKGKESMYVEAVKI